MSHDRRPLRAFYPTVRAIVIIGGLLALLLGPALQEADIVALMLSTAGLAVIFVTGILVLVSRFQLKSTIRCTVVPPPASPPSRAGTLSTFVVQLSPFFILPPLELRIRGHVDRHATQGQLHIIRGRSTTGVTISEAMLIPHRGSWVVNRLSCICGDRFGLWGAEWDIQPQEPNPTLMVEPPVVSAADLPILSSAEREGDLVTSTQTQQGDLYDLKPYHPSDGTRRVVWKIFARSGELVSRKPEAAITPEGHTALLCLATGHDDMLAAQSIIYAERLEELGLSILGGTLGMGTAPVATTAAQFKDLVIAVVRGQEPMQAMRTPDEFATFLEKIRTTSTLTLNKVACLVSEKTPEGVIIAAGQTLMSQGIEPIFLCPTEAGANSESPGSHSVQSALSRFFFSAPQSTGSAPTQPRSPTAVCTTQGWTLVRA